MVIFTVVLQFSFAEFKKTYNAYFFQSLHFLTFPTIYSSLPCFPLKWRTSQMFPRGLPEDTHRRSGVTLKYASFRTNILLDYLSIHT